MLCARGLARAFGLLGLGFAILERWLASAAFGSLGLNDCAGVRVYIKDVPVNRDYKSLICYIVGTPLQFSFGGSASTEPAAEKMLASLE